MVHRILHGLWETRWWTGRPESRERLRPVARGGRGMNGVRIAAHLLAGAAFGWALFVGLHPAITALVWVATGG